MKSSQKNCVEIPLCWDSVRKQMQPGAQVEKRPGEPGNGGSSENMETYGMSSFLGKLHGPDFPTAG